jgi:Cu-Zn family superoxide dismutase
MKLHPLLLLIPSALLFACSRAETPPADTVTAPASAPAATTPTTMEPASAMASLAGKSGKQVTGELRFTAVEGGGSVNVTGAINGLTKGAEHGFHVHERGDCSAPDAGTAGEHLNPAGVPHGRPTTDAPSSGHLGDMPNVTADDTGRATVNATIAGATLRDAGNNDLIGKAVIVHARRDDYTTQPGGDAGDRIACGVIR